MATSPNPLRIDDLKLFADCSKAELRQIGSLTTFLQVPRDQVLTREGDLAKEFIVIASGTARVTREMADGPARVADVGSGDFLGEMALLSGGRRTATATAATDLTVLVSSLGEFRSILETAPSVARKVHLASIARASRPDLAA
jgi:CRP-like cAMP-binding protein